MTKCSCCSCGISCEVCVGEWYENGELCASKGGLEDWESEGIIEDCVVEIEGAGREEDRWIDTKLLSVPWLL